jgi:hypothetical protein
MGQEVRYRDNLRQTLIDKGVDKDRRSSRLSVSGFPSIFEDRSILSCSAFDLQREKGQKPQQINELQEQLKAVRDGEPPTEALDRAVKFLQERGLDSPKLQQAITRYRTFLTEGRLSPLG